MVPEKKCSLCNETKPASEFSRMRKASSGLCAWCKKCNCQRTLISYRERPALTEPRVQSKRCSSCKVVKPADAFHGWRKGPDGLQGYCKACSAEKMMLRQRNRKMEQMKVRGEATRCESCVIVTDLLQEGRRGLA
jgi:hypothetical protein